jgi:hypothetical protein
MDTRDAAETRRRYFADVFARKVRRYRQQCVQSWENTHCSFCSSSSAVATATVNGRMVTLQQQHAGSHTASHHHALRPQVTASENALSESETAVPESKHEAAKVYRECECKSERSGAALWDLVVITAADHAQSAYYEEEVCDRLKQGSLPCTRYEIIADKSSTLEGMSVSLTARMSA